MSFFKKQILSFFITEKETEEVPIEEFEVSYFSISEKDFEDDEIYEEDEESYDENFDNLLQSEIKEYIDNNVPIIILTDEIETIEAYYPNLEEID